MIDACKVVDTATPCRPCFICDGGTSEKDTQLQFAQTSHSKTGLPIKLGQLIGDDFMVIVSVDDRLCLACITMLDHADRLEIELDILKKVIMEQLKAKYQLTNDACAEDNSCTSSEVKEAANEIEEIERVTQEVPVLEIPEDDNEDFQIMSVVKNDGNILDEESPQTENMMYIVEPEYNSSNVGATVEEDDNIEIIQPSQSTIDKKSVEKFICHKCGLRVSTESQLRRHRCGKKSYKCTVCKELFNSQGLLRKHIMTDHLTKFLCHFCSMTFKDENEYTTHVKTHLSNPVSDSLSTQSSDKITRDIHKCRNCTFITNIKSVLDNHEEKCTGFKCDSCQKKFQHEDEMNSHVCTKSNKYQCGICSMLFDNKDNLVVHLKIHKTESDVVDSKDGMEVIQVDVDLSDTVPVDLNSVLYRCGECSFTFDKQSLYLEHMSEHRNQRKELNPDVYFDNVEHFMALTSKDNCLNVPYISKVFQDDFESLYMCQVCNIPFSTKLDLEKHLCSNKNGELKYTVKLDDREEKFSEDLKDCSLNIPEGSGISLPSLNNYQQFLSSNVIEIQNENTEDCDKFLCGNCEKSIPKNMEKLHREQCFLPRKKKDKRQDYSCNFCDEKFKTKKALKAHEELHPVRQDHLCQFCSETFKTKKALKLHEEAHPESFTFQCVNCDKKFSKEKQLKAHQNDVHRDPHCQYCGKEILNYKTLRNHEQRHNRDSNKRKLECDVCKRAFKTRTGLRHHFAVHTGHYKYFCDFCQRGFMSRMMLEEHRSRHTREDRYICDVCGRKFTFQSTYWIHRKWHDNPFPYKCNFCGRLFRHTSLLAVHKRKHTGERPYKCPHCPLSFAVGGTLKRHLILHTKKYPFHCEACNRGFTTRHKYSVHLAKTHNNYDMIIKKSPETDFKMVVRDKMENTDIPSSESDPNNFEFTPDANFTLDNIEEDEGSAMMAPSIMTTGNDEENPGHVFEIILETPLQQISTMQLNESCILPDMWCQ